MPHGESFDMDCALCHATDSWEVDLDSIKFDHKATHYPLYGAHTQTECRECHQILEFAHISIACADCHTDIHKSELGFRCENCHTPVSWENRREIYEQHIETNFPLVGVHAVLDCQSCHIDEQNREYANTPIECSGCHSEDFNLAMNPDHHRAGFETKCDNCHLPNSYTWNQTAYPHTELFPLTGGHSGLECQDCHAQQYTGLSADCYICHKTDYENSNDPNHLTFGFPQNCQTCHTTFSWDTPDFDHLAVSDFALNGAHKQARCTSCHVNNQITGLPRDCFGCHENDYLTTTNPAHVPANFSRNCIDCHSEDAWSPATFDHDQTSFTLTGAHISVDCIGCHIDGQFAGTPNDCWSCHETAFSAVADPNHVSNNFDHDCTKCHETNGWSPATFDHNSTMFPLTGAHITVSCISCHESGYTNTPAECIACHQSDYDNTTDPAHAAAQFPTGCSECHSTNAWEPASWDHDGQYFPIYSGSHRQAWNNCGDCHKNPASYAQFECIFCHDHEKTRMDEKHHEVNDYSFDSPSCFRCHPDGRSHDD